MCGIVGYTGSRDAYPILLKGLKRLEYRGYDSAGIALWQEGNLQVYKKKGRVADLEESLPGQPLQGNLGIGHTRWATHGEPSDRNAHPHVSQRGRLTMIHNGIIENYAAIKQELVSKGYTFQSDTDTEVLLNFIEEIREQNNCDLEEALRIALRRIVGAYCILLLSSDDPSTILAARKGSPLVIGIGKGEHFLASDASPIIEYLGNEKQTPYITRLDMELSAIEKGGYEHFMLKEIMEQPDTVFDCLRGRLLAAEGQIIMSGIDKHLPAFQQAARIMIVACGTSWHAGLVAEYLIETFARIPVEVEYASEFRYRDPVIHPGDIIIAISQSGETADTLVALESAKSKGAFIFGVVNAVGSSIARLSDAGAYTHAGPEIGVASTKAFTGQLAVLLMMALKLGKARGTLADKEYASLLLEHSRKSTRMQEIFSSWAGGTIFPLHWKEP